MPFAFTGAGKDADGICMAADRAICRRSAFACVETDVCALLSRRAFTKSARAAAGAGFAVVRGAAPRLAAGFEDRFAAAEGFLTGRNTVGLKFLVFFPPAALLNCTGTITPSVKRCPSVGALGGLHPLVSAIKPEREAREIFVIPCKLPALPPADFHGYIENSRAPTHRKSRPEAQQILVGVL
jgi:hypothetical protein